jgi:GNAT superfamily N-acetyltransferase
MAHHFRMTTPRDSGRVLIRPATRADLPAILEFRLAMLDAVFAGPDDPEAMRRDNAAWLDEHFGRDFSAWMADLDGRPVASAGLLWFPHPPGPTNPRGLEAYILNVYTRPEARRLGLARGLMERLVEEARSAGVRRIWLRASDEGRPLYEDMGFRTSNYLQLTPE